MQWPLPPAWTVCVRRASESAGETQLSGPRDTLNEPSPTKNNKDPCCEKRNISSGHHEGQDRLYRWWLKWH